VLDGVDVTLHPATTTIVSGENGSGKSTLLRVMAGLSRPTSGEVHRPHVASYVPERQPEGLDVGVSSYLSSMGSLRGLAADLVAATAPTLLDRLGLDADPRTPLRYLSKGNRQKVLLAQAFLTPVPLIVLDEPFSGLDDQGRVALAELVLDAAGAGSSVVAAVHDHESLIESHGAIELRAGRTTAPGARDTARDAGSIAAPPTTVVVRAARSGLDGAGLAAEHGAVVSPAAATSPTLALSVPAGAVDALLADALARGWSVVRVVPDGGVPEARA